MLVEQGQLWDIVMVIIQGSVLIERENIEVADGGFIGRPTNTNTTFTSTFTYTSTSCRWPTAASSGRSNSSVSLTSRRRRR